MFKHNSLEIVCREHHAQAPLCPCARSSDCRETTKYLRNTSADRLTPAGSISGISLHATQFKQINNRRRRDYSTRPQRSLRDSYEVRNMSSPFGTLHFAHKRQRMEDNSPTPAYPCKGKIPVSSRSKSHTRTTRGYSNPRGFRIIIVAETFTKKKKTPHSV